MRLGDVLFNNFWPKLISLVLAVATWFYIFDLVSSDSFSQKKETAEDIYARYKFTVKEVPVSPVFSGNSPTGYHVVFDKVKVEPSVIAIFGPEEVLKEVDNLSTDRINLGEYTRSVNLRLGVRSDLKFLRTDDKAVDVYLPVEPVTRDKPE